MEHRRFGAVLGTDGALLVTCLLAFGPLAMEPARAQTYDDGLSAECDEFGSGLVDLGILDFGVDLTDEGWTWVDPGAPFRSVVGEVTHAKVASTDSYLTHDSHDFGVDVLVDPGNEPLVSLGAKHPNTIEIEWETGILPGEKTGDGAEPMLPKWAWPSIGDRVWANGHWVYDCGHQNSSRYPTEIHPARAIASMRDQARPMPGTGTTAVPVTAVDLWIHGRGGFTVEQLYCGMEIIFPGLGSCPTKTTPIADDFDFDVCLPPQPSKGSPLAQLTFRGPYNKVLTPDPEITIVGDEKGETVSPACQAPPDENGAPRYDQNRMAHVKVSLKDTGTGDDTVYSRRIYLGWIGAPDPALRHLTVSLEHMVLHHDKELPGGNCACSFFWMNVDRSPFDEWSRLSDFDIPHFEDCQFPVCSNHTNTMEDYDDHQECCFGQLDFSGPTFDFYALNGRPFTIRASGYDQDCFDKVMGFHQWDPNIYVECAALELDELAFGGKVGHGDPLTDAVSTFAPPDYGVSPERQRIDTGDYGLDFRITEMAMGDEDTADLAVTKTCMPDGEVALAGEPFTCAIVLQNLGPGLPRNAVVVDAVVGTGSYTISDPRFTLGGDPEGQPCEVAPGGNQFVCAIGTVPVGGTALITVTITPENAGEATNQAVVSADSADPEPNNNIDEAVMSVVLPVEIDVMVGSNINPLQLLSKGAIPVAVLTTDTFDATTIDPATVCFGDVEDPSQRDCTEAHGKGHIQDVDLDRDLDLVLHYETAETGIDAGDTEACLIGATLGGTGVYGCDGVRTR